MTDRNSRSAEVRVEKTRRKPWQPPSSLDAPKPPPGYKYRWIRESILGQKTKRICLSVFVKDSSQ